LSILISDILLLILRPDQQDFQGIAVTVEVARKLKVKRLLLVVNKVLPKLDKVSLRQQVQTAYDTPVASILPVSEELIELGSAGIARRGTYDCHLVGATARSWAVRGSSSPRAG